MEFIEGEFYQFKGPNFTMLKQHDYVLQYIWGAYDRHYVFKIILADMQMIKLNSSKFWVLGTKVSINRYDLREYTITKL